MLCHENGHTIGSFVFEDILCQWEAVEAIVTDNGPGFVQAVEYLSKQYRTWSFTDSPNDDIHLPLTQTRRLPITTPQTELP